MASNEYTGLEMDIVDAPSRDRLFDSMKYAYDPDIQIVCEFSIINTESILKTYGVIIEGLSNEDDSGHSFGFDGRVVYERDGAFQLPPRPPEQYVIGRVSTKSPRNGVIVFSDNRLSF